MREGWRWFGPDAGVSLDDVRQAGASDIVSALHHVPIGEVWTEAEVAARKNLIEETPPGRSPLRWSVVESIPIADRVKREGKVAAAEIEAWIASMESVARCGISTICYNFMPVVDWTRTQIDYVTATGSTAMRFDHRAFAAFELFVLQRDGVEAEYSEEDKREAAAAREQLGEDGLAEVARIITSALPGSTSDALTLPAFKERLRQYSGIDAARLRQHLIEFLEAVTPAAESLGVKLTLHPDDPPRPLLGLPRVASTEADYAALFDAVPSGSNGMCFCTGSLGVRADNDLVSIFRRFASRVHFVHLRSTRRESDSRSFHEAAHLDGDVDMIEVIKALVAEDRMRSPAQSLIYRPDHGQRMLTDLTRQSAPGYPAVGRLRGLAELRGVIRAVERLT
ncbi:mannonate dehydratase [Youhaiella tibetensis]|uniref:Mannonate dehydratase n=1 Tax=Paradevosia tibetensis TaxID=1447062 RepID=A0A5B9DM74_9HYPH|nr:mannonate dehydratase [Youhaiella tibetensis]QEE19799.1 mannonate dehydratase [Youhaiella tibetensis]GGF29880.1 mannonate dehydratase [Youhaiella tibetensis]